MAYLYDNGFTVETLSDVFFDITTASYGLSYFYPNLKATGTPTTQPTTPQTANHTSTNNTSAPQSNNELPFLADYANRWLAAP